MVLVLLDVEKCARIARPDDVVGRVDDAVGEVLAALDVAHANGENFRAEIVGAPGELRVIGRMGGGGEMKERLALGPRVAVDQHHLLAAVARSSAIDPMLAAVTVARIIGPGPVDLRRLAVVLLEARPHFAHELFLQLGRRREQRVGIGVLRLEQRADVGRQPARVAQHLAPVLGPNPGIVVVPGQAVGRVRRRANLGARRLNRCEMFRSVIGHAAAFCHGHRRVGSARRRRGTSEGCAQSAAALAARSSCSPP